MDISCPTVILLSILGHFFVSKTTALKCYVCGIDGTESCDNFTLTDSKFMMECGAANNSCRFERAVKENMFLTRSCANVYLRDCKTANSIEFCYCTQDLCNFLGPFGDNEEGDSPGEEGFEGSGLETTTVGKPTSLNPNRNVTYVTTIELPKSLCSICQFSDLLLTLSTLLLMYLFIP